MLRETQATTMEIVVVAEAGRWVPEDTVRQLCSLNLDWDSLHTLQGLLRYNSLGRILRYLTKQRTLAHSRLRRRKIPYAITVYRDYLDMAKNLGCNLKKKAVLEPRDLKAQHDLLSEQLAAQKTVKENLLLSRAIENGLYEWAQEYASEDYCVVYPQTKNDFINEGRSLHHCVGNAGYYDRHVLGRSMVFFIRRASQPEKPFFTTEIDMDAGRIKQLYGFSDCSAPKEVRGFVEGFVRAAMRWRSAERMAS